MSRAIDRYPISSGQNDTSLPTTVAPVVYASVLKRLGEVEEKVSVLEKQHAQMLEKEEMLHAAVSRIDALELELTAAKKALEGSLAWQEELLAYVEKRKKKNKLNPCCWRI